jgi:hypothetical protein
MISTEGTANEIMFTYILGHVVMFSRLLFVSQSGAEGIGMVTGTATRTTLPF